MEKKLASDEKKKHAYPSPFLININFYVIY